MNIIGVSAGYHDSACCVLQNGAVVAAAQEERFSRTKNDRSVPRRAFRYCLAKADISMDDIDCLAYFEDPCLKLGRQLWMGLHEDSSHYTRHSISRCLAQGSALDEFRRVTGYDGRVEVVDHHLSHAASSYYFSGFDDAAILTVDGVGDWPTTTYGCGRGAEIERLETVDFPDSLGLFYSALTAYLGFEVNEGEYKIMGLAPYGEPRFVAQIERLIEVGAAGQYRLNMQYFGFMDGECMYSPALISLLGRPARAPESEIDQFHMDVARSTQLVLEEILLGKVRYLHNKVPSDNLCMAGGVALNVVANGRCLREGPFKRLFVQPAAGDAGGALGAAAVAQVRVTGRKPEGKFTHVYLGPNVTNDEAHDILRATSRPYLDFRNRENDLLKYTAEQLAAGRIVGWCQGRSEFGPRALGARSILADPRSPDMRDRINRAVKKREMFRPFAPSVLATEQHRHFDLNHDSPFMLETCQVISGLDLPAITHVDGSARVHSVSEETNARFARLLEIFYQETGCPILLNTSFNLRGEPIVLTVADAIACFVMSAIDLLIVEDFAVEREAITPMWQLMAHQRATELRSGQAVGHLVYTFF